MMKYIGKGDFVPDIPARDLSEAEVSRFGRQRLLDSGLYEDEAKPQPQRLRSRKVTENEETGDKQ